MAAVGVGEIGTKRGDLGNEAGFCRIGGDKDDAKVRAYGKGARKEVEDNIGSRAGGDVVVGGLTVEQEIAHAAAGEVGLIAVHAQRFDDLKGCFELGRPCH